MKYSRTYWFLEHKGIKTVDISYMCVCVCLPTESGEINTTGSLLTFQIDFLVLKKSETSVRITKKHLVTVAR